MSRSNDEFDAAFDQRVKAAIRRGHRTEEGVRVLIVDQRLLADGAAIEKSYSADTLCSTGKIRRPFAIGNELLVMTAGLSNGRYGRYYAEACVVWTPKSYPGAGPVESYDHRRLRMRENEATQRRAENTYYDGIAVTAADGKWVLGEKVFITADPDQEPTTTESQPGLF